MTKKFFVTSMKFLGKKCLMIILKVIKNQGFTLSLEHTFFAKLHWGSNWPPPPSVLGLNCLKCVLFFKYTHILLSKLYSVFIALGAKYFLRKINKNMKRTNELEFFFFWFCYSSYFEIKNLSTVTWMMMFWHKEKISSG